MTHRSITIFYFIAFIKCILCCTCHGSDNNTKGDSDLYYKFKRQLENDYHPTDYVLDNAPRDNQLEIGKLLSELVSASKTILKYQNMFSQEEIDTKENFKLDTKYNKKSGSKSTEVSDAAEAVPVSKESMRRKIFGIITKKGKSNLTTTTSKPYYGIATNIDEYIEGSNTLENEYSKDVSISINQTELPKFSERKRVITPADVDAKTLTECPRYKNTRKFEIGKMADVWKIVYHTMPHKMKCFKLYIKSLTTEDQIRFADKYGTFNNTVQWDKCNLEIKSSESHMSKRKHFLQGSESDNGIMENVIIDEIHLLNVVTVSFGLEHADQWVVIDHLLLMRDCKTGEVVVFSRVPLEPGMERIRDALKIFGEPEDLNGTKICGTHEHNWIQI